MPGVRHDDVTRLGPGARQFVGGYALPGNACDFGTQASLHLGARFAFEHLPEAYRAMAARRVAGKIVIEL